MFTIYWNMLALITMLALLPFCNGHSFGGNQAAIFNMADTTSNNLNAIIGDLSGLESDLNGQTSSLNTMSGDITSQGTKAGTLSSAIASQAPTIAGMQSALSAATTHAQTLANNLLPMVATQTTKIGKISADLASQTTEIKDCITTLQNKVDTAAAAATANCALLDALNAIDTCIKADLDTLVTTVNTYEANRDADIDDVLSNIASITTDVMRLINKELLCPPLWFFLNNRCFKFWKCSGAAPCTINAAKSHCESRDVGWNRPVHLARAFSPEENYFISGLAGSISSITTIAIGGTDVAEEGEWIWPGNLEMEFRNWYKNQPNNLNGGQDCLYIRRGRDPIYHSWDDTECDKVNPNPSKVGWVCEFEL